MTLHEFAKRAEKLVADNSPTILTAIGVTGTLTTAYLTGKASFKAATILAEEQNIIDSQAPSVKVDRPTIEPRERFLLVWKLYIPAATTATFTIVSIVGANRIGTRRAAAMAAAYSISEKAFTEYKDKVVERIGSQKEQSVRDELAQDRINKNPPCEREVIITDGGEVLCFDEFTGRYFKSTMELLKKAENDVNHQIINSNYASLTNFYNNIGIPATSYSEEVGWNADKLMELQFSTTLSEDNRPCISVGFAVVPIRDYYRVN